MVGGGYSYRLEKLCGYGEFSRGGTTKADGEGREVLPNIPVGIRESDRDGQILTTLKEIESRGKWGSREAFRFARLTGTLTKDNKCDPRLYGARESKSRGDP